MCLTHYFLETIWKMWHEHITIIWDASRTCELISCCNDRICTTWRCRRATNYCVISYIIFFSVCWRRRKKLPLVFCVGLQNALSSLSVGDGRLLTSRCASIMEWALSPFFHFTSILHHFTPMKSVFIWRCLISHCINSSFVWCAIPCENKIQFKLSSENYQTCFSFHS